MSPLASKARVAGAAYLCLVISGVFTLAYAPSTLVVDGDPAATFANITRREPFFRATVAAGVVMSISYLVLAVLLFRLLKPYGRSAATFMVLCVAVSVPLSLAASEHQLAVLNLVESRATPDGGIVAARLDAYERCMDLASIFWGLWLAPLGILIVRSGVIPRLLGGLLIVGCIGYLANFFGPLLYPGYQDLPWRDWISRPGSIGEIGTCIWLLIFGARDARPSMHGSTQHAARE